MLVNIMMRRNYIFKVWGSTLVISPVVTMLASIFIKGVSAGVFAFIAVAIAYGVLLSLPTLTLVYLLFPILRRRIQKPHQFKTILLTIGIMGILVTFYFLYGRDGFDLNGDYAGLTFSIVYSVCLIIFGLVYSLEGKKAQP